MELKYTKMQSDMEKLKITDLSIGDWVQAKQTKLDYDDPDLTPPMKIVAIDNREPKQAYVDLAFGDGVVAHSAFVEDLRPIPISIEILEKNEFKAYSEYSNSFYFDMSTNIRIWLFKNSHDWTFQVMNWGLGHSHSVAKALIKYVHQLQHAMRLADIDKDITL